jgi:hypothetical protein
MFVTAAGSRAVIAVDVVVIVEVVWVVVLPVRVRFGGTGLLTELGRVLELDKKNSLLSGWALVEVDLRLRLLVCDEVSDRRSLGRRVGVCAAGGTKGGSATGASGGTKCPVFLGSKRVLFVDDARGTVTRFCGLSTGTVVLVEANERLCLSAAIGGLDFRCPPPLLVDCEAQET